MSSLAPLITLMATRAAEHQQALQPGTFVQNIWPGMPDKFDFGIVQEVKLVHGGAECDVRVAWQRTPNDTWDDAWEVVAIPEYAYQEFCRRHAAGVSHQKLTAEIRAAS